MATSTGRALIDALEGERPIKSLLANGAPVNFRDVEFFNRTPVHYAASKGRPHALQLLIKYGADIEHGHKHKLISELRPKPKTGQERRHGQQPAEAEPLRKLVIGV